MLKDNVWSKLILQHEFEHKTQDTSKSKQEKLMWSCEKNKQTNSMWKDRGELLSCEQEV